MSTNPLHESAVLLKAGKKAEARKLLAELLQHDSANAPAWYGLSFCLDDPQQKRYCLERALAINPTAPQVKQALARLDNPTSAPLIQAPSAPPAHTVPESAPPTVQPHMRQQAGASTRQMAEKRKHTALWIGVAAIFLVLVIVIFILPNARQFGIGGIGILLLIVLARIIPDLAETRMKRKFKEADRASRGAVAEELIGGLLDQLGGDFEVLHDVESPYGNIDHLILCKSGAVFLVETKSHRGKVTLENEELLLNGYPPEKDFIAQCLSNSYWLRDQIETVIGTKPWITPILVFTNAFVVSGRPLKGVVVVNKKYLLQAIRSRATQAATSALWENKEQVIQLFL